MFRLWGKIIKNNRMLKDMVYCSEDYTLNRTKKVFKGLEEICLDFDLGNPIWLKQTIEDFKVHSKCRFTSDNFIERIAFDYLEIQVIEEDY